MPARRTRRREHALAFGGMNRIKDDTRDARGTDVRRARRAGRALRAARPRVRARLHHRRRCHARARHRRQHRDVRHSGSSAVSLSAPIFVDPSSVHRVYVEWTAKRRHASARTERSSTRGTSTLHAGATRTSQVAAFAYRMIGRRRRRCHAHPARRSDERRVTSTSSMPSPFSAVSSRGGRSPPAAIAVTVLATSSGTRSTAAGATFSARRCASAATYRVIGVAPPGSRALPSIAPRSRSCRSPRSRRSINAASPRITDGAGSTSSFARKPASGVEGARPDLTQRLSAAGMSNARSSPGLARRSRSRSPSAIAAPLQFARGPTAGPESRSCIGSSGVAFMVLAHRVRECRESASGSRARAAGARWRFAERSAGRAAIDSANCSPRRSSCRRSAVSAGCSARRSRRTRFGE